MTPEEVAAVTAVTVALQQRDAAAGADAASGPEPLSAWVDASRRSAQTGTDAAGPVAAVEPHRSSLENLTGVIHDPELFTVGPDEVVVTFRTDDEREVETRVGDRGVVTRGPYHSARVVGLEPATTYPLVVTGAEPSALLPAEVTTLGAPAGRLLATVATVNDVHFGETECGLLGVPEELGPVFSVEPGAEPYPEVMNGGAIDAIDGSIPTPSS